MEKEIVKFLGENDFLGNKLIDYQINLPYIYVKTNKITFDLIIEDGEIKGWLI